MSLLSPFPLRQPSLVRPRMYAHSDPQGPVSASVLRVQDADRTRSSRSALALPQITDKKTGRMIASALLGKMQPAGIGATTAKL